MADSVTNAFEIERRGIMWTPLITLNDGVTSLGYDGDPNDVIDGNTPGETWLYSLPIGQFYKQLDATLWWKSEAPNVWINLSEGGGGITENDVINRNYGAITLPTYVKEIDGTLTVNGDGVFNFTTDIKSDSLYERISVTDNPTLTVPEGVSYICVEYNAGTPIYGVETDPNVYYDSSLYLPVFRVTKQATNLSVISYGEYALNSSNKLLYKDVVLNGAKRLTGLELSSEPTRVCTVSSGKVYFGDFIQDLAENKANVSGDLIEAYPVSGVWNYDIVTEYDSTYYSNGTNRISLGTNKWVSKYIYRSFGDDNTVFYIHGNQFNKDEEAFAEDLSNVEVPTTITSRAIFVGKIVIKQNTIDGFVKKAIWDVSEQVVSNGYLVEKINNKQILQGHVNRTDSDYEMVGDTFRIFPTGTFYTVYGNDKKIIITSEYTVDILNDRRLHFIYFDCTNGFELVVSLTPWDIKNPNIILTAIVFKDGINYAVTDERHGYRRNIEWHDWAHRNIGAMYNGGLEGSFTDNTLSIGAGIVYDEDIRFETLDTKTTCTLWYRSTVPAEMRMIRNSTTPYYEIDGVLQYENNGVITPVSNNNYVASWVYFSNDPDEPVYVVVGQQVYGNLNQARNAPRPILNLSTAEWKLLYRVLYRNMGGTPTLVTGEVVDLRGVQTGVPVSNYVANDHSSLINRDAANSHPAEAISYELTNVKDTLDTLIEKESFIYKLNNDIYWSKYIKLVFNSIANVPVADATDVGQWNTFFNTTVKAVEPFDNVVVDENNVYLFGADQLKISSARFSSNSNILAIYDTGILIELEDEAFMMSNLTYFESVSLETIGESAFEECFNLHTFIAPNVKTIEDFAFFDDEVLELLEIPNVVTLGRRIFTNCIIKKLVINKAQSIDTRCFEGCNFLEHIEVLSLTTIGTTIFNNISGNTITVHCTDITQYNASLVSLNENNTVIFINPHEKRHSMIGIDHLPSSEEDRGKFVRSNPLTGEIEFFDVAGVNGAVFITNMTPQSTGNVGGKIFSSDGTVLDECTTDTQLVTVSILALTGNTNYKPVVSINGTPVTLSAQIDAPLFIGSIDVDLDNATELTVSHEDGAQHTIIINQEVPPEINDVYFNGDYPGTQTELKENDIMPLQVSANEPIIKIEVDDFEALKSGTYDVTEGSSHLIDVTIADRGNTPQNMRARVRVQKSTGSWSEWFTTRDEIDGLPGEDYVVLNNLHPTITITSIDYPIGQEALKNSESATITFSPANADVVSVNVLNVGGVDQLSVDTHDPAGTTVVSRISGDYNISSNNLRFNLLREANGAIVQQALCVQIAHVGAVIDLSFASRLRSGGNDGTSAQNHVITMTSNQRKLSTSTITLTAPEGTWQGGGWVGATTSFTRSLQIHDNDIKGGYTFTGLSFTNLSGIETTTINSGSVYTIGGFVSRQIPLPAFAYETEMNVEADTYNKVTLSWSFSPDVNIRVALDSMPIIANSWCLDVLSVNPTKIRILDNLYNSSSQESTITIEEII